MDVLATHRLTACFMNNHSWATPLTVVITTSTLGPTDAIAHIAVDTQDPTGAADSLGSIRARKHMELARADDPAGAGSYSNTG
jgi:hypothetical protein